MAKSKYTKPYVDSSVIVAWIHGEKSRTEIFTDILKAAEAGLFRIFTSSLTIVETHRPRGQDASSIKKSDELLDFFEHDFLEFIDVDRRVAERAHRLCRDCRLRPCDAIHVACALKAGCEVLLTWDGDYKDLEIPSLDIRQPEIVIGQPTLPDLAQNVEDESAKTRK